MLSISFLLGALLKNSAQVTSSATPRGYTGYCDTYVKWLCVPTYFFSIHLAAKLWLVIDLTSLITSAVLFVFGVLFIRE